MLGSCVILQGIRTSIVQKPYICVIFQGGSGPPVPPSGSAHVSYNVPPTSILHLDSNQPVRMCSCKRISIFAISFMKMTFTSANFLTMIRRWLSPAHISYKASMETCPNSCNRMKANGWACFSFNKRTTMF